MRNPVELETSQNVKFLEALISDETKTSAGLLIYKFGE